MASPDSESVQRFLQKSLAVRIATLSPAGNPDLIPLWFLVHEGRIYMAPRAGNPVVRDLTLNPEVALLFHGEQSRKPDRALRVRGQATFVRDPAVVQAVQRRALRRYYLSPGGFWNTLKHLRRAGIMRRYYGERGGDSGVIEVVPETAEFLPLP